MLKKIVIKVEIRSEKCKAKAMKIAAVTRGVNSVSMEGEGRDQLVVTGDGVDSVQLANKLRKKICYATILSVQDTNPEDAAKKADDQTKPIEYIGYCRPYPQPCYPCYPVVYDPYPNNCSIM